jgi:hypothetical protein
MKNYGKNYGLPCVVLLLLLGFIGCGTSDELDFYRSRYEMCCEFMAVKYRSGDYDAVSMHHMLGYFKKYVGKMTVEELRYLLGEPRVVTPKDEYYGDALSCIFGFYATDPENWDEYDKHYQVLLYSECGPPDHWISDESTSLFFVIKNGVVIGVWVLA